MKVKDILNQVPNNAEKYLEYYFRDMIGLPKEKNIFYKNDSNSAIAIMKDETKRVLEGTGKLRERPWSNFLFYFIEKKTYKNLFGTNSNKRSIKEKAIIDSEFSFTDWDDSYGGKDPHELYLNNWTNFKIAKYLFDEMKKRNPFLFIRSYVYLTIVLYDESEGLEVRDFQTYYFNTNYKFTETNGRKNFISNVSFSYLVENIDFELELIQSNNRDVLDCVRAYSGKLDFIDQTKYHFDNIVNDIEGGDEYMLIEGAARTGKTIIAMCLLSKYKKAHLLVMNHYFYLSLKDAFETLNIKFPMDRIFHQFYGKVGYYNGNPKMNFDFSIIDECQRLGEKYGLINEILRTKTHKSTVLLGDDYQKLKRDSDDGITYVVNKLIDADKSVKSYKFNNSIGVPHEVVKNIKYLLGSPEVKNPYSLGEYSIKLFENETDFFKSYETEELPRKHIATIQAPAMRYGDIGKFKIYPLELMKKNYPYFLNKDTIDTYYFSPYEMISREVDTMYVYVRENISVSSIKEYVLTQLYVLMTRATISLNLYFDNSETKDFIEERLREIDKLNDQTELDVSKVGDREYIYISEGQSELLLRRFQLESPKSVLQKRFVSRLVHFTDERNIPNIIKLGIVPREDLRVSGESFVFNDDNRYDGHPNSICLSVENPNIWLLNAFKRKYPDRKFKLITINPAILYSAFQKKGDKMELVDRYYCNYNAASNSTKKSKDNIEIMYSSKVQTYNRIYTRENKIDSLPTVNQAEILFFGTIPSEYIDSIEDI